MSDIREMAGYDEILKFYNGDHFVADVWSTKYGDVGIDRLISPIDAWKIIAEELENEYVSSSELLSAFTGFKLVPGGRIISGLLRNHYSKKKGKKLNISLSNCLFSGGPEDDMDSIMDYAKHHAHSLKMGYGNGLDLSKLRPDGSPVSNAAKTSSGIIPFANLYSEVTKTVGHQGRRGAAILMLDVKHPDVIEFIKCKNMDTGYCTGANLSVKITDAFMHSVEGDLLWDLEFANEKVSIKKEVRARELFRLIAQNAWDTGEPGLLFMDALKNLNPGSYHKDSTPTGVNPCGEISISDWEQCVLGCVMLDKFLVVERIDRRMAFDYQEYTRVIHIGIKMLNAVVDYELKHDMFPNSEIRKKAEDFRRIGLGISALADTMGFMNIEYKAIPETREFLRKIFSTLTIESYWQSKQLSKEFDIKIKDFADEYWENPFFSPFINEDEISESDGVGLAQFGPIANVTCNTIAPTGSLSIIAGGFYSNGKMIYCNSSSGIEPVFSREYTRKTNISGKAQIYTVMHGAIKHVLDHCIDLPIMSAEEVSTYFPTIDEVSWKDRVYLQGFIQHYIDNSISSTVNLPESTTVEEIEELYQLAWICGCKGITVFRNGCKRCGILVKKEEKPEEPKQLIEEKTDHISRPPTLYGVTEKIKFSTCDAYISVSKTKDGIPLELFMSVGKSGSDLAAANEAIGRLVSLCLSYRVPIESIIKQLEEIGSDEIIWHKFLDQGKPQKVNSIVDAVAKLLRAFCCKPELISEEKMGMECPQCKEKTLIKSEGCLSCSSCGFSKCT